MYVHELSYPITKIKGIGKVTASDFAALGVEKASDLITLFPRSYDDRSVMRSLNDISEEGGTINTAVTITEHSHYFDSKKNRVLKLSAKDLNSGRTLYIHCFGRSFMENAYPVGSSWFINANVTRMKGSFSTSSFTLGSEEVVGVGKILPIYPLSGSLTQRAVRKAVDSILGVKYIKFDDELPPSIIQKHHLMHTDEAIRQMHHPRDIASLEMARKTIAYSELFYLELSLLRKSRKEGGKVRKSTVSTLEKQLLAKLPFKLTEDQEKCLDEIRCDLDRGGMNRLLQGDVGSGKTLVAWLSALHVIAKGGQTAFMAPTELLARQHAEGAAELLLSHKDNPEVEIDKVSTPGGITIKGLNCMERYGFSTAVIEGLKASK